MAYADLLKPEAVLLDVDADDGDSVLQRLVDALVVSNPGLADRRQEILDALQEREAQGSTASQRVAMPHVKLPGVEQVTMAVAVHRRGVDFRALDGEPVHVFFSLIRPEENAEEHLGILRWLAGVARHHDFVPFALQAQKPEQLIDLLTELAST